MAALLRTNESYHIWLSHATRAARAAVSLHVWRDSFICDTCRHLAACVAWLIHMWYDSLERDRAAMRVTARMEQDTCSHVTACVTRLIRTAVDRERWTPVIWEAGRKFSFEIKKHENPELFAVSVEYLLFPVISRLVWVVSCCSESQKGAMLSVHSCIT